LGRDGDADGDADENEDGYETAAGANTQKHAKGINRQECSAVDTRSMQFRSSSAEKKCAESWRAN